MKHNNNKQHTNIQNPFREAAAAHQSQFRQKELMLNFDKQQTLLSQQDAEMGANFYKSLHVFEAVKLHSKFHKSLYANMLKSEHIPFNFFVPLKNNPALALAVFNQWFKDKIESIDKIKFEYSPKPIKKFLNDDTFFEVYVEYTHKDKQKGMIGISLKYTEMTYPLLENSEKAQLIANQDSIYHQVTQKSNIYHEEFLKMLPEDKFRELWLSQLLAESIVLKEKSEIKHATLLFLYPKGNQHLGEAATLYQQFVKTATPTKFVALTYENFISALRKATKEQRFLDWSNYLTRRYIVR